MFNSLRDDKRTPLSAACSLIHQLLNGSTSVDRTLVEELCEYMRTNSGQEKADNFEFLWGQISKHVQKLVKFTLIIDSLDECENGVVLLKGILKVLESSPAKIVILSRREAELTDILDPFLQIRFDQEENHSDILAFLQSQISKDSKLASNSVKRRVHRIYRMGLADILLARANGLCGQALLQGSLDKNLQCQRSLLRCKIFHPVSLIFTKLSSKSMTDGRVQSRGEYVP